MGVNNCETKFENGVYGEKSVGGWPGAPSYLNQKTGQGQEMDDEKGTDAFAKRSGKNL